MTDKIHILGNGDTATLMPQSTRNGQDGKVIVCNQPPFNVKAYACALVDFKMMKALQEGSVNLDMFNWVCGNRPKMHMAKHASLH